MGVPLANLVSIIALVSTLSLLALPALGEDPFEIRTIESPGRTAAAELSDFDGDGRSDLLAVTFSGLPPVESRQVRLYFQREDGSLPDQPDWVGALPRDAAVYDLADLPDAPGTELILLTPAGVTVMSFAERIGAQRKIPVPGSPLIAVSADERSLDRMWLARDDLGPNLRIIVPGFMECAIVSPSGEVISRLRMQGRANYYMPPRPGPLISGSEIEVHFDSPRLNAGDIDGDGRNDLLAADRHEVRIFRQREDGTFPSDADTVLPVGRVSEDDHIRSSGNLAIDVADFNGDRFADLMVSHSSGGLFQAHSQTRVHLNQGGVLDLKQPDQLYETDGGISTVQLLDLDGNGIVELVIGRIPMGVLPLVEMLLTKAIDAEVDVYRIGETGLFDVESWFGRDLEIPFNIDTNRPMGFFPDYDADLNADGFKDLLMAGKGDVIDVYLGGDDNGNYRSRAGRQKADSAGRLRFGDLDGDGRTDLLLYDPMRPDSPIRIARNRGVL